MGRRKFLPPFATWYAANRFAIVPLRNILPGSPPPGAWIDQAIVQWVLTALTVDGALRPGVGTPIGVAERESRAAPVATI